MDFMQYCNINEYHSQGFKGKGLHLLNTEPNSSHGNFVIKAFLTIAPEATAHKGTIGAIVKNGIVQRVTVNSEEDGVIPIIDYINKYNIKIINTSLESEHTNEPLNVWLRENVIDKLGVIMVNSAGNQGGRITGIYKYCSIIVGVVNDKMKISNYSGKGEELDFVTFLPITMSGTSFSSPCLAGQIALLLNKYGDMNQYQIYKLLKANCQDLEDEGADYKSGHGFPILPLAEAVKMEFKDVKNHWAEKDIDKCVENGILNGFTDGTFRPEEPVTRAQMAAIISRLLEKMK